MTKKTTKKKGCTNCKKKEILTSLEVPVDEVVISEVDIRKAWTYLTVNKRLQEEDKLSFTQTMFKQVTGQYLDAGGCTSCKISKFKRMYKHHAEKYYNIILK